MDRRSFLRGVAALPLAGVAAGGSGYRIRSGTEYVGKLDMTPGGLPYIDNSADMVLVWSEDDARWRPVADHLYPEYA